MARIRINRRRWPICSWSAEQGNRIFPCPCSRLRIWSRETGSANPSLVSLLISILRLNLVLTGFLPISAAASIYLFKPPYTIGLIPSLSGHTIGYRWCLLLRIRRYKAGKPQGSFKRVLPWLVTMDKLMCASLSHPTNNNCYEVVMLKVPAYIEDR